MMLLILLLLIFICFICSSSSPSSSYLIIAVIIISDLFKLSFLFTTFYIFYIETEKYESKSIIIIKDLAQDQSVSTLGSLLLSSSSSGMKDAMLLEVYLPSRYLSK